MCRLRRGVLYITTPPALSGRTASAAERMEQDVLRREKKYCHLSAPSDLFDRVRERDYSGLVTGL